MAIHILFGKDDEEEQKQEQLDPSLVVNVEQNVEIARYKEEEDAAIGKGFGDERFREWVKKFQEDSDYRKMISDLAERVMLQAESKCGYSSLLKEDSGILNGEKRSHYSFGDDPNLIDFEESIDNIITQRKDLSGIRYDDLIILERRGQQMAAVFLQDISGSMYDSLKDSIICTVILLFALKKHEIAMAFFESDLYAIKEFFDEKSVEGYKG